MTVYDVDLGRTIVRRLEVVERLHDRSRGLIGHRPLQQGEAMLLRPARWIHTFGMSFPIDVIYVSRDWRVVAVSENLVPRRIDRPVLRAYAAIEMATGSIRQAGLAVGDRLELRPGAPGSDASPTGGSTE